MEQEHVVIGEGLEQVVAAQQIARRLRRPLDVLQLLEARPVRQFHQGRPVERGVHLVDFLGLQLHQLVEPGANAGIGGGRDLQADRRPPLPREHGPLDRLEQVVGLVALDGNVGVAGDAEQGRGRDLGAGEERAHVGRDHVFQAGQADVVARQADPAGNLLGNGRHGDPLARPPPSSARTATCHCSPGSRGEGCSSWTASGVSTGRISLLKYVCRNFRCSSVHCGGRHHADAGRGKLRQGRQDAFLLLLHHAMDALADGPQLRGRGHAGRVAAANAFRPGAHQAGHADEEELVQVGTDDGQELDAFQAAAGRRPGPGGARGR